jgi:hypothetical protein
LLSIPYYALKKNIFEGNALCEFTGKGDVSPQDFLALEVPKY